MDYSRNHLKNLRDIAEYFKVTNQGGNSQNRKRNSFGNNTNEARNSVKEFPSMMSLLKKNSRNWNRNKSMVDYASSTDDSCLSASKFNASDDHLSCCRSLPETTQCRKCEDFDNQFVKILKKEIFKRNTCDKHNCSIDSNSSRYIKVGCDDSDVSLKQKSLSDDRNKCSMSVNVGGSSNDESINESIIDAIDTIDTSFEKHGNRLCLQINFVLKPDDGNLSTPGKRKSFDSNEEADAEKSVKRKKQKQQLNHNENDENKSKSKKAECSESETTSGDSQNEKKSKRKKNCHEISQVTGNSVELSKRRRKQKHVERDMEETIETKKVQKKKHPIEDCEEQQNQVRDCESESSSEVEKKLRKRKEKKLKKLIENELLDIGIGGEEIEAVPIEEPTMKKKKKTRDKCTTESCDVVEQEEELINLYLNKTKKSASKDKTKRKASDHDENHQTSSSEANGTVKRANKKQPKKVDLLRSLLKDEKKCISYKANVKNKRTKTKNNIKDTSEQKTNTKKKACLLDTLINNAELSIRSVPNKQMNNANLITINVDSESDVSDLYGISADYASITSFSDIGDVSKKSKMITKRADDECDTTETDKIDIKENIITFDVRQHETPPPKRKAKQRVDFSPKVELKKETMVLNHFDCTELELFHSQIRGDADEEQLAFCEVKDEVLTSEPETEEDKKKNSLKHLKVQIPFEVPILHIIESNVHMKPNTGQKEQFEALGLEVNVDPFSEEEDAILRDNWKQFCKVHRLERDCSTALALEKQVYNALSRAERIKFARFLGRNLDNRTLHLIHARFNDIIAKKSKLVMQKL